MMGNYSIEGLLELWRTAGSSADTEGVESRTAFIHTQSSVEEEIRARGPDEMKKFNSFHLKLKGELYFNEDDFKEWA